MKGFSHSGLEQAAAQAAFPALRLEENNMKLGTQSCLFVLTVGTVPFSS